MKLFPKPPGTSKPATRSPSAVWLVAFTWLAVCGQGISTEAASRGRQSAMSAVEGQVRSSGGEGLPGVYVRLLKQGERKTLETKTGADGRFVLSLAEAGTYVLHAEKSGWRDAATEPFEVVAGEKKKLELVMQTLDAAQAALPGGEQRLKTSSENIEFQDEPSFTVAGVTDYSNLGLHGSDAAAKTSDRLATAIVELNSGARGDGSNLGASQSKSELEREREQVSKELAAKDTADGHRILGSINERLGDPVTAVREFAEAARMDPSEQNYFTWGADLLLHRAGKPAAEVFARGAAAHPDSARMRAGLGAALYAVGSDQEAAERLCEAADLKPGDAAAYIFLGQMEKSTAAALPCSEERLARFAKQQPGNARANYYYALSLRKRERAAEHPEALRKSEMLLEKAVSIDPKFADAYLELGNFYFERAAITEAMGAYQKAIAAEPHMSQAHYQLSLAYRRSGEQAKAEREFQMYKQDQNTETAALERQRKEMRQFLVILKNEPASSPPR